MTYCTGNRASMRLRSDAMCTSSRWCSSALPSYHGMLAERSTMLSPCSADTGMNVRSCTSSFMAKARNSLLDLLEALLAPVDEVHLVDAEHEVRDAEQRREERVASRLLEHALAGVDEDQREVGGGRAGDHVARVLDVPRGVGDDELPLGRGEVAVGDVDGDALLALGAEAVGEQRQVRVLVAALARGALHRLELVLEDRLRVVEEPPDERRLPVVDRPRGRQPQHLHQK